MRSGRAVETAMAQSLDIYEGDLARAFRRRRAFHAWSGGDHYAVETLACGLRFAEREIRILSGCLDVPVFGDFVLHKRMREFLRKPGSRLSVLTETDLGTGHPVLLARDEFSGQVSVRKVPEGLQARYGFGFMLFDDVGYRFVRGRVYAVTSLYEASQKAMQKSLGRFFERLNEQSVCHGEQPALAGVY